MSVHVPVQLPHYPTPCQSENSPPHLALDVHIPSYVLNRRRPAVSSGPDSLYQSEPRMKRRGAVSYQTEDPAAQYIRYLGDALKQRNVNQSHVKSSPLPELPTSYKLSPSISRRRGRRGSFHQVTASKCYKETIKGSVLHKFDCDGRAGVVKDMFKMIDRWDFNVFAVRRLTEGRPLFYIGLNLLLQKYNSINLDVLKTMKFLALVEEAYHHDNCYHNGTHAADVAQALHCLLMEPRLQQSMTRTEAIAAILAAICHDLDHPGVNQNFLLNTSSYLAAIHGKNSVLERHHCQTAKAILKETQLLDHLQPEHQHEIISLMENMILATDVSRHKDFMAHFEDMLISTGGIDLSITEDRHFMLLIAIKAADVSNPTRCLPLSRAWSEHIMEEFFRQGDSERSMKLPISFLCDRTTTTIPKSQSGFFEFVALPLFKAWSKLFGSRFSVMLCKNISKNKAYWDKLIPSDSDEEQS